MTLRLKPCACFFWIAAAAIAAPTLPSSIVLSSSASPSVFGQPVTITATLTPGATGKVTFYDGTTILGISLISGTQATITTSMLSSGVRSLHAHYSGDAVYLPSDSLIFGQIITVLPANGFQPVGGFTGPGHPEQLTLTADFNGDGKPDLAVAPLEFYGGVGVFLGKGDGTFSVIQPPLGGSPHVIAVADFNADGRQDLVVAYSQANTTNSVYLLLGNGNSDIFLPPLQVYVASGPVNFVAVGDFNGDGKADFVLAGASGITLLLGNGDASFQPPITYAYPANVVPSKVLVGDFNRDQKADLVVVTNTGVDLLLGTGDGHFQTALPVLTTSSTISVAIGDFNTDGKLDLAMADANANSLNVVLGNGDGTFLYLPNFATSFSSGPASIAVADWNADGKPDLIVASVTGNLSILAGYGNGTFQPVITYFLGTQSTSVAVADFNGDGRVDLAIGDENELVLLGVVLPDLTITASHSANFVHGGSGANISLTVSNSGLASTSGLVTVVDILPSGLTPTAIGGQGWTCVLSILTCTRSDALGSSASYPPIAITVNVANNIPANVLNTAVVFGGGEMNTANERASDMIPVSSVVRAKVISLTSSPNPAVFGQPVTLTAAVSADASNATGPVVFYAGSTILGTAAMSNGKAVFTTSLLPAGVSLLHAFYQGDANYAPSGSISIPQIVTTTLATGFQPAVAYQAGTPAACIVVADFNSDGKPDVAVCGDTITVLLGNGDGTFRLATRYPIGGMVAVSMAVADFNGDGAPDLVIATQGAAQALVLLSNGSGSFRPPVAVAFSLAAGLVATGDFNGDGRADVVFTSSANLVILLGNGDGTFRPIGDNYTLTVIPVSVVVADFNGDGMADLAFANGFFSSVSICLGNGDGTLQPPINFLTASIGTNPPSGVAPMFLAVGDFNRDGKPDLAAAGSGGVEVLAGNGDGTFRLLQTYYATNAFVFSPSVAVADFNGDGKLDLAVVNEHINTIVMLLGNGDGTFQQTLTLRGNGTPGTIAVSDFNGDGRPDLVTANDVSPTVSILLGTSLGPVTRLDLTVWRPSNGTWYVNPSNKPLFAQQWGLSGDLPLAADFDDDGALDFAVWRPSNGTWYIIPSILPSVPQTLQWGLPGDIPIPADFDGDGKSDLAVWRPSNGTWYILPSQNPTSPIIRQWGLPGDIPIVFYNGVALNTAQFVVWRPSNGTWYQFGSTNTQWGLPGDIPVAADFDGDGKTDIAVWRPTNGTWYIIPSTNPGSPIIRQWGLPGDIPVPRDFDLDGKADIAVWRPSNGTWYIIPSSAPSAPLTIQWGLTGDVPIYKPAGN